jgi:hypothetical protein
VRHVRGVVFLDYVRMLRAKKDVSWAAHLAPDDLPYLTGQIDPGAWYPMASFERMGNAILSVVAGGQLMPVQLWGRLQAAHLKAANPTLLAPRDPIETLTRFHVLRQTFFDFEAVAVRMLHDDAAQIAVTYHMGMPAEEAAAVQTMGFFEGLLELAGATDIGAKLTAKSWANAPVTLVDLRWSIGPVRGR